MQLFRRRAVAVGARPGTLVGMEGSPPPRVRFMDYTSDEVEEGEESDAAKLRARLDRDSVTWIEVQGLGDTSTLKKIGRSFGLHDLLLEDASNVPQRPKVEEHDDHLLIVTRVVGLDGGHLRREQVSIVIGRGYVITFEEQHGDQFESVRARVRRGKGSIRHAGPDYLAYAILDLCIDSMFPVIDSLGDLLEELEEAVIDDPTPTTLRRVNDARGHLLILRRLLWASREATQRLARDEHALIIDRNRVYYRDVHDATMQAVEFVESFREMTTGLMSTYLSAAGNKMNEVMKVLTIMASIFIPLTFMAGIYGMNFAWMPELGFKYAYPMLLVAMAVTAVAMVIYFARRGWIGSPRDARSAGEPR